ncbi:lipid-A-disaccharide synthase [Maritimibacter sp. 55A14]|uniref:lipid-A-disaccharide synthase n=1 Tax=Maritimibacter sp. 55A14 TaxID=2174844 RepID=UPI000D60361C|nr:lipid-A-disaccharide synthase [Maritimibacter sp. 55A14]PWE34286.1 lipid-A-disaccharide synthase [Maritimibacter sp. 55A14]
MTRTFFLIAGEASGDRLGASLMQGLAAADPDALFIGVGGPLMQAAGLESIFPMDELSVMGITEVLPRLRHLLSRRDEAVDAVLSARPAALITIDSPDFCLRVARRVKAAAPEIRTIHYVAPTVWAWRPGRAAKMAQCIDHVLALFPFESPYMQEAGMGCDFVGHPVVCDPVPSAEEARALRARHEIAAGVPLICVLPGSRRGEVSRLAPIFGEALRPVLARLPEARVVIPAARHVAGEVLAAVARWPGDPVVLDPREMSAPEAETEKRRAFAASDAALAASGTVALELAATDTPMVVAYDMNWLSRRIIKRLIRIDTVNLVNIVTERRAVPEFIGEACRPAPIAEALLETLTDGSVRAQQLSAARETMRKLGRDGPDPGLRAARAVLDAIS